MNFLQNILKKIGFYKENITESNNENEEKRKTTKEMQQEFLNNLNINTNNILNPKVCKGKKFIQNILISLGADEELVNNEIIFTQIKPFFIKMVPTYVLEKIENCEEFTTQEIEECIRGFFEKTNQYSEMLNGTKNGKSLLIDSKGKISSIDCVIGDKDRMIIETDYYKDGENTITLRREGDTNFSRIFIKKIYNNLGVLIGKEERRYTQPSVYTSTELIRDTKYPFIVYKRNGESSGKEIQKRTKPIAYPILNSEDCVKMNISNVKNAIENIEDIPEFYQQHKKQILNMFKQLENLTWLDPLNGTRKSDIIKQVQISEIAEDYEEVREI